MTPTSLEALEQLAAATAPLFVPGDRPERFAKAAVSGDLAILDLEDAVAPAAKDLALDAVAAALTGGLSALVRICALDDPLGQRQLAALAGSPSLAGVVVAKAEDPAALTAAAARLHDRPVVALIETARGVLAAPAIAAAPGVGRLALGLLDLANDLFVPTDSPLLDHGRAATLLSSRAAGLPAPWDSPTTEIKDIGVVQAAAEHARTWGFGGKLCIHPGQVESVRTAFRPSSDEIDWARRIVAAAANASGGVVQGDGTMIDRPVTERARRILHLGGLPA
jgi:citrate lyase subunit beta / citryl-CoA lyase